MQTSIFLGIGVNISITLNKFGILFLLISCSLLLISYSYKACLIPISYLLVSNLFLKKLRSIHEVDKIKVVWHNLHISVDLHLLSKQKYKTFPGMLSTTAIVTGCISWHCQFVRKAKIRGSSLHKTRAKHRNSQLTSIKESVNCQIMK